MSGEQQSALDQALGDDGWPCSLHDLLITGSYNIDIMGRHLAEKHPQPVGKHETWPAESQMLTVACGLIKELSDRLIAVLGAAGGEQHG